MTFRNDKNTYIPLFWVLFSLYISFTSYGFGLGDLSNPGPGCFPFAAGVLLLMISAFAFVKASFKPSSERTTIRTTGQWRNLLLSGVSMCAYVCLLKWLGFVACTFLLMVFSLRVVAKVHWRATALFALCVSFGAYLLFHRLLDTELPINFLGF